MGSIVWAGFLAFFVASLTVGVRLLLLWRRTRQLPELLIGLGVLGIGPIGFGLMMGGQAWMQAGSEGAGKIAFTLGSFAVYTGVFAKYVFNWRVYHPASMRVRAVVAIAGCALLCVTAARLLLYGFVPTAKLDSIALSGTALQLGALFWGSFEALRYWQLMRKRGRIGLADPVVTNRFLLWGIGAGAAGMGSAIGTAVSVVLGVPSLQVPWVVALSSGHGLVAAIAMWLAFLPPAAYLRHVRARATRA